MSTVPYSEYISFVAPEVPGCPRATMIHAIRQAVIEFCVRTKILKQELDPIIPLANIKTYELDMPTAARFHEILTAYRDDAPMNVETSQWMDENVVDWRNVTRETPEVIVVEKPGYIRLYPYVTAASTYNIYLTVALKPTQDSTYADEIIYEEFVDIISHGALRNLMRIKGKPWSGWDDSREKEDMFNRGISTAKVRRSRGYSRRSVEVKPRFFA